jgi:hypothetical protein
VHTPINALSAQRSSRCRGAAIMGMRSRIQKD